MLSGIYNLSVGFLMQQEKSGSLLIVEDDKDALKNIEKYFSLVGYQVKTATDGLDALRVLKDKNNDFQILITDLVMPNIDGIELISTVTKEFPDIKIIAITGFADRIGDLSIAAKTEAIFLKPLDLSRLENSVKTILREYFF